MTSDLSVVRGQWPREPDDGSWLIVDGPVTRRCELHDAGCKMGDVSPAGKRCHATAVQSASAQAQSCGVRIVLPLESGRGGGTDLSAQVAGFSRGANGANENWPNSHIFPPFLASSMWGFFRRGWRKMSRFDGELCERCKLREIRGLKMQNRMCKILAHITLRMWSPAFCRKPPRQNVRLLFAFCSLKFYIFFVNELRMRSARVLPDAQGPAVHGASVMSGLDRVSPYQRRTKADDGPVWSGLDHAKKAVNALSVGLGRFTCEFKVLLSRFKVERNAECGIKSSCEF
jgi:hypothetical protein